MNASLILENSDGELIRSFFWDQSASLLVHRLDTQRIVLLSDTVDLEKKRIPFKILENNICLKSFVSNSMNLPGIGVLKLMNPAQASNLLSAVQPPLDKPNSSWWRSFLVMAIVFFVFAFIGMKAPLEEEVLEEEVKEHIVKIIKPRQVRRESVAKTPPKVRKKQVRRMGVLGVLGQLKNSKNKGGVNVAALNTTAGAGLGGSGGSGGIQTSLYGKGVFKAPLGPGGNIKGAGGYGSKGKGGGKAGYGALSLIGSSGTSTVPLAKEANIGGGLDREQVAAVIRKNMGQIRFCYEQGLQSDAKISGRVAVDFVINAQGRVSRSGIKSSSLNSSIVEKCIMLRLRSWKFPLPDGGKEVKISYPFVLKRVGQG